MINTGEKPMYLLSLSKLSLFSLGNAHESTLLAVCQCGYTVFIRKPEAETYTKHHHQQQQQK